MVVYQTFIRTANEKTKGNVASHNNKKKFTKEAWIFFLYGLRYFLCSSLASSFFFGPFVITSKK